MLNVTFELERRKSLHYSLGEGGRRDIPGKKDSRRKSTQTEKCPFKFKIACSSVWLVSVLYNGKSGESHLNGLLGSEHAKMTNAYGPHPTGNGETLNIFEQGGATTGAGLQEIHLAASPGDSDSDCGKMRGRENSEPLLRLPRVSGWRKERG